MKNAGNGVHTVGENPQASDGGPDLENTCLEETGGRSGPLIINEVQLILAEKRTALAVLRTGIAVLALPMSILGLLIATSKYYDTSRVLHLIIPLGFLIAALVGFGSWLVITAFRKMRRYDRMILRLKKEHCILGTLIE